jgi:DinB family protein
MGIQLMTKIILKSWHSTIKRANALIDSISDEEMNHEIVSGRNRGVYLLGHLAAVHDMMLPLLNLGELKFPELSSSFIRTPDDADSDKFTVTELRKFWNTVNANLAKQLNNLSPDEWLEKHSSISEEDFAKEPHRNRMSVLISRTNHLSYHLGQFVLLKK